MTTTHTPKSPTRSIARRRTIAASALAVSTLLTVGVAAAGRGNGTSVATASDDATSALAERASTPDRGAAGRTRGVTTPTIDTRGPDDTASDTTADPVSSDATIDAVSSTVPASASDVEPVDEVDEPEVGGDAGAVTQFGGVNQRPSHPAPAAQPPAPASSWEPIALTGVEGPAPDMSAIQLPPVDVPSLDSTGPIGQFSSNAFGCLSRCIASAVLQPSAMTTDLGFTLHASVAVQTHVWVLPAGPFVVNGVPTHVGKPPTASSPGATGEWSTTLGSLEPSTTYRIVAGAVDQQGNPEYATTQITTSGVPDQLVGNGGPCHFQCITAGTVIPGAHYGTVDLEVHANADVTFHAAASPQEPGTIDGKPFLPDDVSMASVTTSARSVRYRVVGLEADTTYHVVVTALDGEGNVAHAMGEFRTDPAPPLPPPPPPIPTDVFISFERIHIHGDGDQSSVNKGEIRFQWAVGGTSNPIYRGVRDRAKIDTGATVTLPEGSGTWVSVPVGGSFPRILVQAEEDDYSNGMCTTGFGLQLYPKWDEACDVTVNVAMSQEWGLGWLDHMQPCTDFGLTGWKGEGLCTVLPSGHINDDFVDFDALVSFHVA
jgi:hypothetical protein